MVNHDAQTIELHPKAFNKFTELEDNNHFHQQEYKDIVLNNTLGIMDQMALKILDFIKAKYFKSVSEKITKKYDNFSELSN